MKKITVSLLAIVYLALCAILVSCPGDSGPQVNTYQGAAGDGTAYKLIITGSEYVLTFGDKTSAGTAKRNGDTWTLTPGNAAGYPFFVKVDIDGNMEITGTITDTNGGATASPGKIMADQPESAEGNWKWEVIDDSRTRKWAPGISEISHDLSDSELDGDGNALRIPKDSWELELSSGEKVTVFHFEGTASQKMPLRTQSNYKEGAGWPQVGWSATPADDETWELLKEKAYGYTFMIRINRPASVSGTYHASYQSSVDNFMYQADEGHEPLRWFGSRQSGHVFGGNHTQAEIGQWSRVTAIFDPAHPDYNMDYAGWLYSYGANAHPDFPFDNAYPDAWPAFDKEQIKNIKWQIQLQHNGGTEGGSGVEYSITEGSYDFSVDFYGLKLYLRD